MQRNLALVGNLLYYKERDLDKWAAQSQIWDIVTFGINDGDNNSSNSSTNDNSNSNANGNRHSLETSRPFHPSSYVIDNLEDESAIEMLMFELLLKKNARK